MRALATVFGRHGFVERDHRIAMLVRSPTSDGIGLMISKDQYARLHYLAGTACDDAVRNSSCENWSKDSRKATLDDDREEKVNRSLSDILLDIAGTRRHRKTCCSDEALRNRRLDVLPWKSTLFDILNLAVYERRPCVHCSRWEHYWRASALPG